MNDTQRQLHDFLLENFALDGELNHIDVNQSLIQTGVVDSTGLLELVSFVESTYGITVPDEDLLPENFESIANISAYVMARSAAAAAAR